MMRIPLIAALLSLMAMPAGASILPSSEQLDPFMLDLRPELRHEMKASHFLGLVGIGNVAGEPAYTTDLAGWSYWDRRFFASFSLGGVMFSPKTFGLQKDPQNPSDEGNLLVPIGQALLGYNVIGLQGDSNGFEPLWNLNNRTYLTIGAGTAAGFTFTKSSTYGYGMSAGPFLGLRYKLMDWHNINAYGHYFYGLNRLVDAYEAGLHTSFGNNVIEFGYRGGAVSAFLQRQSSGGDVLITAPPLIPYGAYFVRFSHGY